MLLHFRSDDEDDDEEDITIKWLISFCCFGEPFDSLLIQSSSIDLIIFFFSTCSNKLARSWEERE